MINESFWLAYVLTADLALGKQLSEMLREIGHAAHQTYDAVYTARAIRNGEATLLIERVTERTTVQQTAAWKVMTNRKSRQIPIVFVHDKKFDPGVEDFARERGIPMLPLPVTVGCLADCLRQMVGAHPSSAHRGRAATFVSKGIVPKQNETILIIGKGFRDVKECLTDAGFDVKAMPSATTAAAFFTRRMSMLAGDDSVAIGEPDALYTFACFITDLHGRRMLPSLIALVQIEWSSDGKVLNKGTKTERLEKEFGATIVRPELSNRHLVELIDQSRKRKKEELLETKPPEE